MTAQDPASVVKNQRSTTSQRYRAAFETQSEPGAGNVPSLMAPTSVSGAKKLVRGCNGIDSCPNHKEEPVLRLDHEGVLYDRRALRRLRGEPRTQKCPPLQGNGRKDPSPRPEASFEPVYCQRCNVQAAQGPAWPSSVDADTETATKNVKSVHRPVSPMPELSYAEQRRRSPSFPRRDLVAGFLAQYRLPETSEAFVSDSSVSPADPVSVQR